MLSKKNKLFYLLLFLLPGFRVTAESGRFRVVWQTDPATAVTIVWDQLSGSDPVLCLDINDYGSDASQYAVKREPDRVTEAKGMNNHYVYLTGLLPNTDYYFLVKDSEGQSRRFYFTTAPNTPDQRLSIIAGGDSRNHRDAR
ncbi:MAG TPA: metallophosphoesterase, partial [Bacteroidetes bacterium]|nr:metallophosphoesterase [Bacteroidota bacterium]